MQISAVAVFLLAAVGAVATPTEMESNTLDARAEAGTMVTYHGTCTRAKNECKFKGQNGKTNFVKCPSKFANKKCSRDGAKCEFDSYSRKVTCH